MKTIEVKSCVECPFKIEWIYAQYCRLDSEIEYTILPELKPHPNCPLKTESVTVKLKDDQNNN